MKPAQFDYHRPASVDEVLELLSRYDGEAKIIAGGQSLVPLLNLRLAVPDAVIDIADIKQLHTLTVEDCMLRVGALVTQSTIETSALVRDNCPLLSEAVKNVAHPQIRARGTIGGTIAHADSASEVPTVLLTLGGEVVVTGPDGERTIPAVDLFIGFMTTTIDEFEMITEVRFPTSTDGAGYAFCEFARREGDFAIGGAAAAVLVDSDAKCKQAQVGLLGAASTPIRALDLEVALMGSALEEADVRRQADEMALTIEPPALASASSKYRRAVLAEMATRAVLTAAQRARTSAEEN